jgi:hypothetical protein
MGMPKATYGFAGVLAVCVLLALVGHPLIRVFAEFGAAYAVWNLVMIVPGRVSRQLEGQRRLAFTILVAFFFPLVLSLYFLQGATDFDPWSAVRYFAGWWALVPMGIIGSATIGVGEKMIDKDHPITGMLLTACVLFGIMYLGYHGVNLSTDEEGYATADPPDPVVEKAKHRAGYDFVIYWIYVTLSYAGIAYGLYKQRAQQRKLEAIRRTLAEPRS